MSILGIISGIGIIVLVLLVTYPLACWVSGADEAIKRCDEIGAWAEHELDMRQEGEQT